MKGRTGSTLLSSSTSPEIHRDSGITVYDQAESDFVQLCQTKMRNFTSRICSEFRQIEFN